MRVHVSEPTGQVDAVRGILQSLFRHHLIAAYLHGSAVSGGLRRHSDIDILALIDAPMATTLRRTLLSELLSVSAPHPASRGGPRCVELIVFCRADASSSNYPIAAEFVYGEWLRSSFQAELPMPTSSPDNTLILAQAWRSSRPLVGPAITDILPEIPMSQVRRAMRDALPALSADLCGDERNVLLTLARMWRTAETGEFVAKDVAAEWAARQIPEGEARTLRYACDMHLGREEDAWQERQTAALETARYLERKILELIGSISVGSGL